MKLGAKHIIIQICYILIMSAGLVLTALDANAAVAPGDENYANNACSTEGLSDKQYDESKCTTDTKCDASSSCVDASPLGKVNRVSDPYGYRIHPITGKWTGHKGVDYATTAGTPIYAGADGVIIDMRYQYNAAKGTGYGNMIKLKADSPAGTTMLYAHMACFASGVGVGTHVKKGQIIGFVGNTGVQPEPTCTMKFRKTAWRSILMAMMPQAWFVHRMSKLRPCTKMRLMAVTVRQTEAVIIPVREESMSAAAAGIAAVHVPMCRN